MIVTAQDTQLQQSEDSQQSSRTTSTWRGAIIPFLGTRLSLVLVGLLTDFYILPLLKRTPILPSPTANTAICQKDWPLCAKRLATFLAIIILHSLFRLFAAGEKESAVYAIE